jgi:hypothetical protein
MAKAKGGAKAPKRAPRLPKAAVLKTFERIRRDTPAIVEKRLARQALQKSVVAKANALHYAEQYNSLLTHHAKLAPGAEQGLIRARAAAAFRAIHPAKWLPKDAAA